MAHTSFVTWVDPPALTHPRVKYTAAQLATLQARCAAGGSHRAFFNSLTSYCNTRASDPVRYPNTNYVGVDPEYVAAFAFAYAMDNTYTTYRDKALSLCTYLTSVTPSSADDWRLQGVALAWVYDMIYAVIPAAQRTAIRNKILDIVRDCLVQSGGDYVYLPSNEHLWGHGVGFAPMCLTMLIAIYKDDATQDSEIEGYIDFFLDYLESGSDTGTIEILRYCGDIDGGHYKGLTDGYLNATFSWWVRVLPALKNSIQVNWIDTELWWRKLSYWLLWHWRGDRTSFRDGEGLCNFRFSQYAHMYLGMVQSHYAGTAHGQHIKWLIDEIAAVGDTSAWGPYGMDVIIYRDVSVTGVRPTVATANSGLWCRHFNRYGRLIIRADWSEGGFALAYFATKLFTGGHSQRDAGDIQLCYNATPLLIRLGSYSAVSSTTAVWKVVGSTTLTGHRYVFYGNIGSRSCVRIHSSTEYLTEAQGGNLLQSYRKLDNATSSTFGVTTNQSTVTPLNIGSQLWEKKEGEATAIARAQPSHLNALLSNPEWIKDGLADLQETVPPNDRLAYVAHDLTDWYWSGKCHKYVRHLLVIKHNRGTIPNWNHPVVIVYDDLDTELDMSLPNPAKTQVVQWQVSGTPTVVGTRATMTLDVARLHIVTLAPTIDYGVISQGRATGGTILMGERLQSPGLDFDKYDDDYANARGIRTQPHTIEVTAQTARKTQRFLTVLFPCTSTDATPPTATLIDEAEYIGATIGGVEFRIAKSGPPYSGFMGDAPEEPPPPPTGDAEKVRTLIATAQAVVAGGSVWDSGWQDVTAIYNTQVLLRLTNGTGITVAPSAVIEVAGTTSSPVSYQWRGVLMGKEQSNGVARFEVDLPPAIRYFRVRVTPATGGDVSVDAEFSGLTQIA